MSSKDFDPRVQACEDFLELNQGYVKGYTAHSLLDEIDRAKDREIARLRKIIDDAGLSR